MDTTKSITFSQVAFYVDAKMFLAQHELVNPTIDEFQYLANLHDPSLAVFDEGTFPLQFLGKWLLETARIWSRPVSGSSTIFFLDCSSFDSFLLLESI